ncbi:MAG: chemotaxis protein CheX [Planctomycetota bacterium]
MPQSAIDPQVAESSGQYTITIDCVTEMVNDLFTSMLGMNIDPTPIQANKIRFDDLLASIQITGDQQTSVFIFTSVDVAKSIASAMFGAALDELETSEVFDALGEVVNVIGGNIKGVLNEECALSLPCVGPSEGICPSGVLEVTYQIDGRPLTVIVVDR